MVAGSRDRSFVIISLGILKRLVGQKLGDQFFSWKKSVAEN